MTIVRVATALAFAVALAMVAATSASADFIVLEAGGDDSAASIEATVNAFRGLLGDPNNGNTAGPLSDGRREINWDGGGAATTEAGTPFAGFQNNRGALFTTPGTGFVQVPAADVATFFANPSYVGEFSAFSPLRVFSPVGSNVTDVTFSIPGTSGAVPATISGFGAVFTDVDSDTSTELQFFDANGNVLFSDFVPAGTIPSGSLSFFGALADAGEQISRVRITSGSVAPGADESSTDDVVLIDDLLYTEPQAAAVPEPGTLALLAAGALGIAGVARVRPRR